MPLYNIILLPLLPPLLPLNILVVPPRPRKAVVLYWNGRSTGELVANSLRGPGVIGSLLLLLSLLAIIVAFLPNFGA
jgi:hypothetical protein